MLQMGIYECIKFKTFECTIFQILHLESAEQLSVKIILSMGRLAHSLEILKQYTAAVRLTGTKVGSLDKDF